MKELVKEAWIAALRSGEFVQGQNFLRRLVIPISSKLPKIRALDLRRTPRPIRPPAPFVPFAELKRRGGSFKGVRLER